MAPALPAGVRSKQIVATCHQTCSLDVQGEGVIEFEGINVVSPQGSQGSFEVLCERSSLEFPSPRGLAHVPLGVGSPAGGAGANARCSDVGNRQQNKIGSSSTVKDNSPTGGESLPAVNVSSRSSSEVASRNCLQVRDVSSVSRSESCRFVGSNV